MPLLGLPYRQLPVLQNTTARSARLMTFNFTKTREIFFNLASLLYCPIVTMLRCLILIIRDKIGCSATMIIVSNVTFNLIVLHARMVLT